MELKDIVHDIEYGIKLKELGVKQDSIFYFTHISGSEKTWIKDGAGQKLDSINYNGKENIIRLSAFTSTELLKIMKGNGVSIGDYENDFVAVHSPNDTAQTRRDEKPCNALAKCLIYLLENKLISIV